MTDGRGRAIAAAVAIAVAPAAAVGQALPFEGRWARQTEWCRATPERPEEQQPLLLTGRGLVMAGLSCRFTSVLPGGVSYRVEAHCEAGGEKGDAFFTFARFETLLHWSARGGTETYRRCPD